MLERWRRRTSTRAVKVMVPSMVLLAGCPQQCGTTPSDGAPAAPAAVAPAAPAAPAGTVFVEDFASSAGFYDRFEFGLSARDDGVAMGGEFSSYEGDHNLACSGPELRRTVQLHPGMGPVTPQQVASQTGKSQQFWWCAPGGDAAKGHLMTGTNGTGYKIAYFSPKQAFTDVSRVCWDQNATTMDAKWTNVVIVPVADVEAVRRQKGFLDLGFDPPGFQDPNGPTTFVVGGPDHVGVKVLNGNVSFWQGRDFVGGEEFSGGFTSTDKATRFQHCMIDDGNGTVRVTQGRPGGTTRTRTFRGAFPDGQVRVVFEDDMYDPPKRDGYRADTLTWHWDNIQIG